MYLVSQLFSNGAQWVFAITRIRCMDYWRATHREDSSIGKQSAHQPEKLRRSSVVSRDTSLYVNCLVRVTVIRYCDARCLLETLTLASSFIRDFNASRFIGDFNARLQFPGRLQRTLANCSMGDLNALSRRMSKRKTELRVCSYLSCNFVCNLLYLFIVLLIVLYNLLFVICNCNLTASQFRSVTLLSTRHPIYSQGAFLSC